jgi:phosphoglycolate phosphatase
MAVPSDPRRHAVIFDLDGTLVDSGADIAASANVARTGAGLPPLEAPVAIGYVGDGVQRLLERVLGHDAATGRIERPVSAEELAAGLDAFAAHYAEHLLDRTAPYPGVPELLTSLGERPLMVATNKPRRFTLAILEGLGMAGMFVRVVAGDDVPGRKPDPAHLLACFEGTDLAPRLATMVGDSPNDVRPARKLAMTSVAVSWGLVARARLADAGPDILVDDMSQLAAALALPR